MRRICLIMLVLLLLLTCTRRAQETIMGSVSYENGSRPDSLFVGLYPLTLRTHMGEPLQFLRQSQSKFRMDVPPGMYTLVVFSYTHEMYKTHFYVADPATEINMNIDLPRLGLADTLYSVAVTGEWAGWRAYQAQPMALQNGQWILDSPDSMHKDDQYALLVNDRLFWNVDDPMGEVIQEQPSFRSIYQGGPVLFNPAKYRHPYKSPEAKIKGVPNSDQFVVLNHLLEEFTQNMYREIRGMRSYELESTWRQYQTLMNDLQTIEDSFDPRFAQLFLEKRIHLIETAHPARFEQVRLLQSQADSLAWNAYFVGELFDDYLRQLLSHVRRLNPNSVFVSGSFEDGVWVLWQYFKSMSSNYQKYNLSSNYFESLIVQFIDESPSHICREYLLYKLAHRYIALEMKEKACEVLLMMKEQYPDNRYVKEGYADQLLEQTVN